VRFGIGRGFPVLFALLVALLIVAAPLALLSSFEANWLWPSQTAHLGAVDWYAQTLVPSASMTGIWLVLAHIGAQARPVASPGAAISSIRTAAPALCLQMEDHYVRVHRAQGSTLELMPLQTAIDHYGGKGLRVHRSWWVASEAISKAERDGRNIRLLLRNGLIVPVARNRVAALRMRGWTIG
jgi:hypothetical protein